MTMRIGESLKMDEYIRREDVIEWFMPYAHTGESIDADVVISDIKGMKAADVAPVVNGRWGTGRFNLETGDYEEQCTHCRNFSKEYDKPYCPNCGAKMDGGNE